MLPGGKPTQIKIEERWLLPAVLELVPEECEVNQVTTMIVEQDDWRKPFSDYFNHGTWPDDLVEDVACNSAYPHISTRPGSCFDDHLVKKYFYGVSREKKLIKYYKRCTMECAVAIKVVPRCITGSDWRGTIGQKSWPIASKLLKPVITVKFMVTSSINHQFRFTLLFPHGHSMHGELMLLALSSLPRPRGITTFSPRPTTFPSGLRPYFYGK